MRTIALIFATAILIGCSDTPTDPGNGFDWNGSYDMNFTPDAPFWGEGISSWSMQTIAQGDSVVIGFFIRSGTLTVPSEIRAGVSWKGDTTYAVGLDRGVPFSMWIAPTDDRGEIRGRCYDAVGQRELTFIGLRKER